MNQIELSTLNLPSFEIEKQHTQAGRFNRTVYEDAENNRFIKIWNDDYHYDKNFWYAYTQGFYNKIALIEHVIMHKSCICGYATTKGTPVTHLVVDNDKLSDLRYRLVSACHKYQMVYIDFHIKNVVEYNNMYYLVDLEAVVPVDKLQFVHSIGTILQYNDYRYRKQISSMVGDYELQPITVRQHTHNEKFKKYNTSAEGRVFLEKEFLPTLAGSVLFVGVSYYTDFYCNLVQQPELFETIDVEENVINDGSPHGHYVCNILDFTLPAEHELYDNVVFFGILGHANSPWEIINDNAEITACIQKVASLVKPGGTLLLGPSCQTRTDSFWSDLFAAQLQNYQVLTQRKIHINYIWHGRRAV